VIGARIKKKDRMERGGQIAIPVKLKKKQSRNVIVQGKKLAKMWWPTL
jgi:hypothetical protein